MGKRQEQLSGLLFVVPRVGAQRRTPVEHDRVHCAAQQQQTAAARG